MAVNVPAHTDGVTLAALVHAIAGHGFAEALLAAAGDGLTHDAAALMVFHPASPPAVLVDRLKPAERGYLYGDYLAGVYALSPFYRATQKLKGPAVLRIFDIAPGGFKQSEYYRRYFALIGVEDMLGVLIPASHSETVFLSFSRSVGNSRFSQSEARRLSEPLAVIAAAVSRHTEIAGPLASRHIAAAAQHPPLQKKPRA